MTIDPLKYRTIFLQEAQDQLASYEQALLSLDPAIYDTEAVDTAYRAVHSLKAGADAVGLEEIAKYSHCLERLLDRARDVKTTSAGDLDHLLAGFDVLTAYVRAANDPTFQGPDLQKVLADLDDKPAPKPAPKAAAPVAKTPMPAPVPVPPAAVPVAPTPPPTLFPVGKVNKSSAKEYTLTLAPENDAYRRGIDPTGMLLEVSKVSNICSVQLDASRLPSLADLEPEECYLQWKVELATEHADDVLDVFSICGDTLDVRLVLKTADEPEPTSSEPGDPSSPPTFWVLQPDPTVFLKFLVETNEINALQAMQSLERQRESRPLIGRLAVELQKMKTEQLFKTLSEIRDGEKFGDAAIRLGFLDECRMAELLFVQQQTLVPITECLTDLGFVEKNRMRTLVEQFHQLARQSPSEHECYVEQVGFISPAPAVATADLASLEGNQAMIGDFCQEAAEHIAEADKHLLIIDGEPTNAESLNSVYRAFHTIKGVASMLGLTGVQTVAHEAENLLNLARESKVVLRGPFLDLTFESCDAIRRQMEIALNWVNNGGEMAADAKTPQLLQSLKEAVRRVNAGMTDMPAMPGLRESGGEKVADSRVESEPVVAASGNEVAPVVNTPEYSGPERRKNAAENETVRVSKGRLDELINLIGELVIAHSMAKTEFDELSRETGAHSRALPELSKIARDIQELSFSLRMIPLQATFQRMSRLVRDLNRKIGKQVELKLEGEETELDKSVVDQLGDPLMHMVRNAIDHGLETPAERVAAGKPETGHLTIRAFHQGGNVHIEIADDGRGLARERILRKAIEKGIVPEGERLTDSEIYALIFAPGFSTAAAVTDVSGRGVGMDVVRRNVESLHGSIHLRTKEGSGTTFTIRLPLTLAIMDGLMVGLGDDVYVLPLLSVVESFRPKPSEIHTVAGRGELVTARGEVIPLIRLHRVLGRPARNTVATSGIVVLVEDQGRKHALFVDELLGQMQAVVKSLDENYCRVEGLAGATILGDGRVAMILDIHGLAKLYAGGHLGPAITESVFDAQATENERTNHHKMEDSLS